MYALIVPSALLNALNVSAFSSKHGKTLDVNVNIPRKSLCSTNGSSLNSLQLLTHQS